MELFIPANINSNCTNLPLREMAAPEGWTLIKAEETCGLTDLFPSFAELSITDYFEVISERARKCRLCSSTVNITARSYWNLKRHFKAKHIAEWNEIEPIIKTAKPKVREIAC